MTPSASTLEALRERKLTSLPAIVRDELGRMIDAGELLPGAWVNEAELATRMGVSRGVVREACRGLEQQGLVQFVVNRGAFVREIGPADVADLYDLRAALFALAGRTLAAKLDTAGAAALHELVARMDDAVAADDLNAYYPLNLRFHRMVFELAGNARLLAMYHSCVREIHLYRRHALVGTERMAHSNAEHRAIVEALAAHDPATASQLMESHVLDAKARVLGAAG